MLPRSHIDIAALEEMRESGDYVKIATLLGDDWRSGPAFNEQTIRRRLLAAELAGRLGRIDDMEAALSPYVDNVDQVPFGLTARVLLITAMYRYRRHEAAEALRLAKLSETIAIVRDEEFVTGEAVQLQGQALWALERWDEAAHRFEDAIAVYAGSSRSYRLGLAYLSLGGVRNQMGAAEAARVTLERGIRILLKSQDDYSLAIGRADVALSLNVLGDHESALKYLTLANETFERMPHEPFSYLTLNNIAATLVYLREFDRAENCVSRAIEKGAEVRSTQLASTYEIKAKVHLARMDWDKARQALATAIEIADQANSQSQKAEVRRTLGKYYLSQERDEEAAAVLLESLEIAGHLRASLLELEIKALLVQATCSKNPVEACKLLSEVEAALGTRPLAELKKEASAARRRINALDQEQYFIISDATIPLLADAKISLLKWLWARALHKARGNSRAAAATLGVTPTYIRKLTKVIPRDLLHSVKKREPKN